MLRVANSGDSFAHFVIPFGQLKKNEDRIRSALAEAQDQWDKENGRNTVSNHWLGEVTGQCDLLLHLELDDFRFVSFFQSRLHDLTAEASGWLHSVQYVGEKARLDDAALHFTIFLRVHRAVYQAYGAGAEEKIIERLQLLIDDQDSLSANIYYSLGWPDLLVRGGFSCNTEQFLCFVLAIQQLHLHPSKEGQHGRQTDAKPFYVFVKTLTLIGFPLHPQQSALLPEAVQAPQPVKGSTPSVRPLVMVRSAPGRFPTVYNVPTRLRELGSKIPLSKVLSIDGKWDLLMFADPDGKTSGVSADEYSRSFWEHGAILAEAGVERTQTHLLVSDAKKALEDLEKKADRGKLEMEPPQVLDSSCRCSQHGFEAVKDLLRKGFEEKWIPETLVATANNYLSVFKYALQDKNNCCDSYPALFACAVGLKNLLSKMQLAHHHIRNTAAAYRAPRYTALKTFWEYAETWCVMAGRVLRERTAGSFEDIFNQSGSLSSYRGGLQKMLYIVDNLVHEFYQSIDGAFKAVVDEEGLHFSTVYEPKSTIRSERFSGIIKIPLRYAFSIHLVLPQLWHEVGIFLFHHRYPVPFSIVTEKRFEVLKELLGELPHSDRRNMLNDTSDMWADLVVLHYGFKGTFSTFSLYLTTFFLDALGHTHTPAAVQRRFFVTLSLRLFFAMYLRILLQKPIPRNRREISAKLDKLDALENGHFRQISEFISTAVLRQPRYEGQINAGLFEEAFECAIEQWKETGVWHKFWREYLMDFIVQVAESKRKPVEKMSKVWLEVGKGQVVDFEPVSHINDYYLKLYKEGVTTILQTSRETPSQPLFKEMAALGRSAILVFHKRQGTKRVAAL